MILWSVVLCLAFCYENESLQNEHTHMTFSAHVYKHMHIYVYVYIYTYIYVYVCTLPFRPFRALEFDFLNRTPGRSESKSKWLCSDLSPPVNFYSQWEHFVQLSTPRIFNRFMFRKHSGNPALRHCCDRCISVKLMLFYPFLTPTKQPQSCVLCRMGNRYLTQLLPEPLLAKHVSSAASPVCNESNSKQTIYEIILGFMLFLLLLLFLAEKSLWLGAFTMYFLPYDLCCSYCTVRLSAR